MTFHELRLLTEFHRNAVDNSYARSQDRSFSRGWAAAKRVTWMVLLAAAFLFYHLIAKLHEALSIL
jgi:hypothetical protein